MKLLLASFVFIACATCIGGEEEPELTALGKRMTAALKENSLANYKACWLSVEKMKEMIGPEVEKNPGYFAERDRIVEEYFPKLRKTLTDEGFDLASAELASSEGKILVIPEIPLSKTNNVALTLKDKNGTKAMVVVDDGVKYKGTWYFADRPMINGGVIKDGVTKRFTIALEPKKP